MNAPPRLLSRNVLFGLLLTLCLVPGHPATAKPAPLPADVQAFLTRREACDHFRGEDPYDAERRAFLDARIAQNCKGTDAQLAALRKKHRNNLKVIGRLLFLDNKVE